MEKIGTVLWGIVDRIARFFIMGTLGLLGKKLTEEQWGKFMTFVKFCFVGLSNFLISYVTYLIFALVLHNYHVGNVMGFVISVLNSFYWNNKYVFKTRDGEKRSWWKALAKTYVSYAFSGLILTEILLFLEISVLRIPMQVGPIINLVITTPINYVINKVWAFRGDKDGKN